MIIEDPCYLRQLCRNNKFNSKTSFNELSKSMNSIKSEEIINELWKWFVIFALFFLVMEILILKVFK